MFGLVLRKTYNENTKFYAYCRTGAREDYRVLRKFEDITIFLITSQ